MRSFRAAIRFLRVALWWSVQGHRWSKRASDGSWYTCGNTYEYVEHEMRCKIGRVLSEALFPERTGCPECGIPSALTRDVSIDYEEGRGISLMCVTCFKFLCHHEPGTERIIELHRNHVEKHWGEHGRDVWPAIEQQLRSQVRHQSHLEIRPDDCPDCQFFDGGREWLESRRAVADQATTEQSGSDRRER
jgi:endogenous inhibitor of DNA gyrase (YacG/DUF329 family)